MSSVFCIEPLKPSHNDGNCGGIWGIWGIWGGGGDCGRGKWMSSHWVMYINCKMQDCKFFTFITLLFFVVSSLNMIKTLDMISFDSVDWGYLQVQWQTLWIVKLVTPSSQQFMEPVIHVCRWILFQTGTFWGVLSPGFTLTANHKSKLCQTKDRIMGHFLSSYKGTGTFTRGLALWQTATQHYKWSLVT